MREKLSQKLSPNECTNIISQKKNKKDYKYYTSIANMPPRQTNQ